MTIVKHHFVLGAERSRGLLSAYNTRPICYAVRFRKKLFGGMMSQFAYTASRKHLTNPDIITLEASGEITAGATARFQYVANGEQEIRLRVDVERPADGQTITLMVPVRFDVEMVLRTAYDRVFIEDSTNSDNIVRLPHRGDDDWGSANQTDKGGGGEVPNPF